MVGGDLWGQGGLVPRTLRGGNPNRYVYIFNSSLKLLVEHAAGDVQLLVNALSTIHIGTYI